MLISFTIDAEAFEQEQKEPVKKTLRISDPEIAQALQRIAKASLTEYLKMLVEGGMPSRADEAKPGAPGSKTKRGDLISIKRISTVGAKLAREGRQR